MNDLGGRPWYHWPTISVAESAVPNLFLDHQVPISVTVRCVGRCRLGKGWWPHAQSPSQVRTAKGHALRGAVSTGATASTHLRASAIPVWSCCPLQWPPVVNPEELQPFRVCHTNEVPRATDGKCAVCATHTTLWPPRAAYSGSLSCTPLCLSVPICRRACVACVLRAGSGGNRGDVRHCTTRSRLHPRLTTCGVAIAVHKNCCVFVHSSCHLRTC